MKKPELLSPAGDMECLYAAVSAGCDAVYLGGKLFGARAFSSNFNEEELKDAIRYCHLYGVKVYVTVNTIIYEREVDNFIKYVDFLVQNGVDALIMQDIGMIDLVHKIYPDLEIHGSTQMHVHNEDGVSICENMGLKRVVLAREVSIEEISNIRKNHKIELEVFIHGALCLSYSGQCLMSALIGPRSGNRGTCTQCCRMEYDVLSKDKKISKYKYPLSTKDLCTIENIGSLIESGVDSLKIEGRMKRKEYVYLVTSLYRKAIDSYIKTGSVDISDKEIENLLSMFNRKFTRGFLFNENNNNFINPIRPNHMGIPLGSVIDYKRGYVTIKLNHDLNKGDGIRIIGKKDTGCIVDKIYKDKNTVLKAYSGDIVSIKIDDNVDIHDNVVLTTDKELIDSVDLKLKKNVRKVVINGTLYCEKNKNLRLIISDGINNIDISSDYIVEESINNPISIDRIKSQLNKLGNTVYKFNKLDIIKDDNIFINIKDLNELRRDVIDELNNKRCYIKKIERGVYSIDLPKLENNKGLNILIHNIDDFNNIKDDDYKEIYIDNYDEFKKIKDKRLIFKLPRVRTNHIIYDKELLVGDIGGLKYKDIITDFSFNVVNSYSIAYLHSLGVKRVTLSYELNDKQMSDMIESFKNRYKVCPNLELIVSSYPEAMISKYNLYKQYNMKDLYLRDKFNNLFKVKDNGDFMTIYHFKKRELKFHEKYFNMGINRLRIECKNS